MKKIQIIFYIFIFIVSCKENPNKISNKSKLASDKYKDRLIGGKSDTIYTRKWIDIDYGNNLTQEIEIYISKYDSIINQNKIYNKNQVDRKESEYYDLEIWDTKRPHVYKGKITMHTVYDNLILNKKNRRTVEFAFCQQTKDSISLKYIESKTSNTIEFEFQNCFGKRLQGKLYQLVYRDTIINGEVMLNMRQTKILVDNYAETINLFLDATTDIKKKKFDPKKLNLKAVK